MQRVPFVTSDLLEVRRQPLKDISNEGKRLMMAETEKKIAESLVSTAIAEKGTIRLQTIKTLGLLKQELARSERNLLEANGKITLLEEQSAIDEEKRTISSEEKEKDQALLNELNEHIANVEADLLYVSQDHETTVLSMHFQREQFADRLFDLEKKLDDATVAAEAAEANIIANNTDKLSLKNEEDTRRDQLVIDNSEAIAALQTKMDSLQKENDSICATLAETTERTQASESSFMLRIELLKSKLGVKTRRETEQEKQIMDQEKQLTNQERQILDLTAALLESEQQLIEQEEESNRISIITAENDREYEKNLESLQSVIMDLRASLEVNGSELLTSRESVQLYETQIISLQVEMEDKMEEKNLVMLDLHSAVEHRCSLLKALLDGEKDRVITLEKRLGDMDKIAEVELEECFDIMSLREGEASEDISVLKAEIIRLEELHFTAVTELIESNAQVTELQVKLCDLEASAQSAEEKSNDSENTLREQLQASEEERILAIESLEVSAIELLALERSNEAYVCSIEEQAELHRSTVIEITDKLMASEMASELLLHGREEMGVEMALRIQGLEQSSESSLQLVGEQLQETIASLLSTSAELEAKREKILRLSEENATLVEDDILLAASCDALEKRVADMEIGSISISMQVAETVREQAREQGVKEQEDVFARQVTEATYTAASAALLRTIDHLMEESAQTTEATDALLLTLADKEKEIIELNMNKSMSEGVQLDLERSLAAAVDEFDMFHNQHTVQQQRSAAQLRVLEESLEEKVEVIRVLEVKNYDQDKQFNSFIDDNNVIICVLKEKMNGMNETMNEEMNEMMESEKKSTEIVAALEERIEDQAEEITRVTNERDAITHEHNLIINEHNMTMTISNLNERMDSEKNNAEIVAENVLALQGELSLVEGKYLILSEQLIESENALESVKCQQRQSVQQLENVSLALTQFSCDPSFDPDTAQMDSENSVGVVTVGDSIMEKILDLNLESKEKTEEIARYALVVSRLEEVLSEASGAGFEIGEKLAGQAEELVRMSDQHNFTICNMEEKIENNRIKAEVVVSEFLALEEELGVEKVTVVSLREQLEIEKEAVKTEIMKTFELSLQLSALNVIHSEQTEEMEKDKRSIATLEAAVKTEQDIYYDQQNGVMVEHLKYNCLCEDMKMAQVYIAEQTVRINELTETLSSENRDNQGKLKQLTLAVKVSEDKVTEREEKIEMMSANLKVIEERLCVSLEESEEREEALRVSLKESEDREETLSASLREGETREETLSASLRESEEREETLCVSLRESEEMVVEGVNESEEKVREMAMKFKTLEEQVEESEERAEESEERVREMEERTEALCVSLKESEEREQTLFLGLKESEEREQTLFLGLKESEGREETLIVSLRESEEREGTLFIDLKESEQRERTLSVSLKESEERVVASEERVRELEKKVKESEGREQTLVVSLKESEEKVIEMEVSVKESEEKMSESDWKLNDMDVMLGESTEKLRCFAVTLKESEQKVAESEERVREMVETVKESEEKVVESEEKVRDMEKRVVEMEMLVKESEEKVVDSEDRASEMEDNVRDMDEMVAEMEEKVKESDGRAKEMEMKIKESEASVREMQGEVKEGEERVVEMEETMMKSEEKVKESEEKSRDMEEIVRVSEEKARVFALSLKESEDREETLCASLKVSEASVQSLVVSLRESEERVIESEEKARVMEGMLLESKEGVRDMEERMAGMEEMVKESEEKVEEMNERVVKSDEMMMMIEKSLKESEDTKDKLSADIIESRSYSDQLLITNEALSLELDGLKKSFVVEERVHFNAIEEHTALITYLQTEIDLQRQLKDTTTPSAQAISPEVVKEGVKEKTPMKSPKSIRSPPKQSTIISKSNIKEVRPSFMSTKKVNEYPRNLNGSLFPPPSLKKKTAPSPSHPINPTGKDPSGKEFSLMQGEMRRFRYARDEAKVSLSKMAGRVAILKDQLHEKALKVEIANHLARDYQEIKLRRLEETARLSLLQEDLANVTMERDELLWQATEKGSGSFLQTPEMSMMRRASIKEMDFLSPVRSSHNDNSILAGEGRQGREGRGDNIQDFYRDTANDTITFTPPSHFPTSSIAGGIDGELRSRLKALKMEGIEVAADKSRSAERTSQLLTARLDVLQNELDAKNEMAMHFDSMKNEMERKEKECRELTGRLFSLERNTVMLQQELSVMRSTQKDVLKTKKEPLKDLLKEPVKENMKEVKEKNQEKSPLRPFTTSMNQPSRSPLGTKKGPTPSSFFSPKSTPVKGTPVKGSDRRVSGGRKSIESGGKGSKGSKGLMAAFNEGLNDSQVDLMTSYIGEEYEDKENVRSDENYSLGML